MGFILFLLPDIALAAILLLPIVFLLDRSSFHHPQHSMLLYILAIYFCAVYMVVGLPDITYIRFDRNINLVPFQYMFSDLTQTLLNVALFFPLGFFLPILWRRYGKFHRTLLFGFCFSLLIELLQIFTYRATDVNDLMTNTLGAALGWLVGRGLLVLVPSILPSKRTKSLYILCGVSFGLMFFLFPFASHGLHLLLQSLFKRIPG